MKIKWHKLKKMVGWQLTGVAMVLSLVPYPTHAFNFESTMNTTGADQVVVATESQYQFPLAKTVGVSQGYHFLHGGVDYRAPKGTIVKTIDSGIVIEVKQMLVGYGHFVRVAHNGTMSSLYAHLGEVMVVAGQKVTKGEPLGFVGMTGWTTGPHLHFELYSGNKTVNPVGYIGDNL